MKIQRVVIVPLDDDCAYICTDYFERLTREDVLELFRFINWVMVLPEELARDFRQELRSYEEAIRMRYVTTIERMASEEGRQEGTLETSREFVLEILETRFGEVPSSIVELLNGIDDPSVLKTIFRRAIAIESVEEFQHVLEQVTSSEIGD